MKNNTTLLEKPRKIDKLLSSILKRIPGYQEYQLNKWEKKWE